MIVKIVKSGYQAYVVGDVAGFEKEVAEGLIESGIAEKYVVKGEKQKEAPAEKPKK